MATLIEFCGEPMVGKATVYHALSKRWKPTYAWMPAHKIYPRKNVGHPLKKLLRSIFLNEQNLLDEKAMRKAASRFIAHYPTYVDECWSHLLEKEKLDPGKTDHRFEKAVHVFKTFQRVQISHESLAATTVIVEGGLINDIGNALHKTAEGDNFEQEIQNLYDLMPLPGGVVFFETDIPIVLKQLNERKKLDPSLNDMSQEMTQQRLESMANQHKTAVTIYEKKGFPVLRLNGTDPLEHNTEKTLNFLKTIPS